MSKTFSPRSRRSLDRRSFLKTGLAGGVAATALPILARKPGAPAGQGAPVTPPFRWEEATITDLQAAMASGKIDAAGIVEEYLARIEAIDRHGPTLNSVIELNPDARAIAAGLDREREATGPRGPRHGIPVLLKDNIDTADRMATTAGSLALLGGAPPG